jgi:recombination protein RecA
MLVVKGGEKIPVPEVIPTPSFGLNYILGGGLWSGRYHIVWGNPQAGKSTMCFHAAAEAQKLGYTPVIIDAEGSSTDEWMEHCGIDITNRIVIRSTILEDILSVIMPMFRDKDAKYFFIFDSINTIVMEQFYKNDDGVGGIGIYARSQGVLIQKVADQLISGVNHCVVFIAQQTIAAKGQYFVTQGKYGNAAFHWATNIIRLNAGEASADLDRDDDERIVGRKVTWRIDKSKQKSVQGTKGDYWFSPHSAEIDHNKEAFHLAVRHGLIVKKGAWFEYGGERYHGSDKLIKALSQEDMDQIFADLESIELIFETEDVSSSER